MRVWLVCGCLLLPVISFAAEVEIAPNPSEEPNLYDHYVSLKHMQERLAGYSLEEQAKMQPQIQRAERRACDRLRKERLERVPAEDYRRRGGEEFLAFAQQFERYCQSLE
jgi:hypothetical protein